MSIKSILIKAKKLIDTPDKWTQGKYEVTSIDGKSRYCALGAISEVTIDDASAYSKAKVILSTTMKPSIPKFNDNTHAEVMKAFDKAIESC